MNVADISVDVAESFAVQWREAHPYHVEPRLLTVTLNSQKTFDLMIDYRIRSTNWPTEGVHVRLYNNSVAGITDDFAYSLSVELILALTKALAVIASCPAADKSQRTVLYDAGFRWCDTIDDLAVYEHPRQPGRVYATDKRVELSAAAAGVIEAMTKGHEYPVAHFATGSVVKRGQYGYLFRSSGIRIEVSDLAASVPEPQVEGQGWEPERILVEDPLRRIARFAARTRTYPLIIEDTMLFVEHFNSDFDCLPILPGPDTKRWWRALESRGLLQLMEGSRRRRAIFVCQLGVLSSAGAYLTFRAEKTGRISNSARALADFEEYFPYTSPYNFHNIFVPDGTDKTYAEMYPGEFRLYDYRSACVDHASLYLKEMGDKPSQLRLFS